MVENHQEEIVEYIPNAVEMKKRVSPLYIISDYLQTPEKFIDFTEKMYLLIKGSIEHKECREYPIKFKFYVTDKATHTLQLRHFIVNLFLWYPFSLLNGIKVIDETFIMDCEKDINSKGLPNYINNKIILVLREYNLSKKELNESVSEVLHNLIRISIDFSIIMGLSMNTEAFLELFKKNSRFREIMLMQIPDDMQPSDGEKMISSYLDEEIEIFKNEKENIVGIILRAGTGIKTKQLAEFTINGGYKPNLEGQTIPIAMNSNTLKGGLQKVSTLTIDAKAARKSLVMNKKIMGKSGYFGKIVTLLTRSLSLSKTVTDCDTQHGIKLQVTSKKMLDKLYGRYYRLEGERNIKLLNPKKDKHLIGKTIIMRSPVTCALGDCVCQKCYGHNANLNYDIADGISAFGCEEVTKVINQSILSAKHLLTTISEKIVFNKEFDEFFSIVGGEISPLLDENPNIDNYAIYIDEADVVKAEEFDDDGLYNTMISNGRFFIINMKTGERIEMKEEKEKELFLTEDCIKLYNAGKGWIKFKDIDTSTSLFVVDINNNELTRPLYEIIDLLNKAKKDKTTDLNEMVQKMIELLIESNIPAYAIQAELIINRLVRDANNIFERPNFALKKMPEYQILTVTKALEKHKSSFVSLSFQELKRQLLSDELFYEKTSEGYLDSFFKPKVKNTIKNHKKRHKK